MEYREEIIEFIDKRKDFFISLCDRIWLSSKAYEDGQHAYDEMTNVLNEYGFIIEAGMNEGDFSFVALYGEGSPEIGLVSTINMPLFLEEMMCSSSYDSNALLNQWVSCGRHVLNTASLVATIAIKEYLQISNIKGKVKFINDPVAEAVTKEKIIIKKSHFKQLDALLTWHPASANCIVESGNTVDYLANETLVKLTAKNVEEIYGNMTYTINEYRQARKIQMTFIEEAEMLANRNSLLPAVDLPSILMKILPAQDFKPGVSRLDSLGEVVPTAQFYGACYAFGTPFFSQQMIDQVRDASTYKGMINAAKILALTASDIFEEPNTLKKIKEDHKNISEKHIYSVSRRKASLMNKKEN